MIDWALVLWLIIGAATAVYVLTGGADFGAGFWDAMASGKRKREQEEAIARAIAPIWEANHIWLIFIIVLMFTAFPKAFSAIVVAFHIPIALVLLGIVFRGSAFIFRSYGIQSGNARRRWHGLFATSSIVTPIFLGVIVGGASTGQIRVLQGRVMTGYFAGWTSPFAWLVGLFTLSLSALLAAVYLARETNGDLSRDFRIRAIAAEGVTGLFAGLVFLYARTEAPDLFARLATSHWTWAIQGATALAAMLTIALLVLKRVRLAPWTAAIQVTLVIIGWGAAMNGHFVLPDVSIATSVTQPAVLRPIAVAVFVGGLILVPSLLYLYRVFKTKDA